MVKYLNYSYIFPPRPKNPISPNDIESWDNGQMIGQPKINGSNVVLFTDGSHLLIYNRHSQRFSSFKIDNDEVLSSLYKCDEGKWMVLNGEYLNKSKKDEDNEVFNNKLIIFDILVYNSEYLIGSTFQERIELLDKIYGKLRSDKPYLYSISDNIYRVKSYEFEFKKIFDSLIKIDMVEGLVFKRKNAKLERGLTEDNNSKSQCKVRKPTKNYKF